jgi:methyl halide transferase
MIMSQDYWEERYRTNDMPWEKGEPSPGLVDFLAQNTQLKKGAVLVPGCGSGNDARALAAAGFQVTGMDIAPSGVELSKQKTADAGLKAEFRQGDFLCDEPFALFDWIFEHTLFCAIQPADRGLYLEAVSRWLKPAGNFLGVFYMIPDEQGPPFGTNRDEIVRRFSRSFYLRQDWVPRSYPNRTGLELMMWWKKKE